MRHHWEEYERRFVVLREWDTLPAMAEALALEAQQGIGSGPGLSMLQKRCAKKKWIEKRNKAAADEHRRALELLASKQAYRLAKVGDTFLTHQELGEGLVAMGANYIKALHEAQALGKGPGAITTPYEALAFIRVGNELAKRASEALDALIGQAPPMPGDPQAAADGLDKPDAGVVFLPQQMEADAWNSQRRKNLGAAGEDPEGGSSPPAPAAPPTT